MANYTEHDIKLAMQAHNCTEEDAVSLGYAALVANTRAEQRVAMEQVLYKQKRATEYPAIGDQLDALWKGGEAAAEMLAKVQAVKAKYPKPTE
jgi:hypothetical protein